MTNRLVTATVGYVGKSAFAAAISTGIG